LLDFLENLSKLIDETTEKDNEKWKI
jgi:hypothetical protein